MLHVFSICTYIVVCKCLCSLFFLGCTFECMLMCFIGCFDNVVNVLRVHYVMCFPVSSLLKHCCRGLQLLRWRLCYGMMKLSTPD